MATEFEKGFRDIFLAGVGAMAITGEKAKEVLDTLIEKGGVTVEQGKDINRELQHKANETVAKVREESIAAAMKTMSAEERAEFAAAVAKLAAEPAAKRVHLFASMLVGPLEEFHERKHLAQTFFRKRYRIRSR